jgi:hypothetical protein
MPVVVDQVEQSKPGDGLLIGSQSEQEAYAVAFEDDGQTGYFYARKSMNGPILDAVHIYDVTAVKDRDRVSEYKIGWSPSGRQAVLMINGYPHAVFDFERQKGWCRSGFPPAPSNEEWSVDGHAWDESCLANFR